MFTDEVKAEMQAREAQLSALRAELLELKRSATMPVRDYALAGFDGNTVKLSDAFDGRDQLVLVHNMGFRCPYCTMWADGFNGLYRYVQRRAAFVLVSNDEPEKQKR
nr:DUF899 domain-containing protein [bacterium]